MPVPAPKHCRFCSRPLTLHEQYSGQICNHWRCRWRFLESQLQAHRHQAGRALGESESASFPITVVPWRTLRTVPLGPERRQIFADHLARLAQETAGAADEAPSEVASPAAEVAPPDPAPVAALLAEVCAVCGGFCCYYGGARHAFLDRETLQRAFQEHPAAAAPDIVAQYLARLPAMHYEGSCVYHSATGCALPRSRRARICNAYECRGLKDARQNSGAADNSRAFVVVRHDNKIIRSAFVDGGWIRRFSGSGAESDTD